MKVYYHHELFKNSSEQYIKYTKISTFAQQKIQWRADQEIWKIKKMCTDILNPSIGSEMKSNKFVRIIVFLCMEVRGKVFLWIPVGKKPQ